MVPFSPRKFEAARSTQVISTVFWDTEGVILINFLPKGHTVNSEIYVTTLHKLREAVKEETN